MDCWGAFAEGGAAGERVGEAARRIGMAFAAALRGDEKGLRVLRLGEMDLDACTTSA